VTKIYLVLDETVERPEKFYIKKRDETEKLEGKKV
jgi:hypothetical protein